jgi:hypothetical protein
VCVTQIAIVRPEFEGFLYVNEGFYDYYRVRDRKYVGSRYLRRLLRDTGLTVADLRQHKRLGEKTRESNSDINS